MKRPCPGNKFPVIDDITVDIEAIQSLAHDCMPGLCSSSKSCCSSFHVCMDGHDLEKVIGVMPLASDYSPGLMSQGKIRNVFDEMDGDLYSIDTNDRGLCEFAYEGRKGETLCALHSVAVDLKYEILDVKPKDCILWPLALTEDSPYILSVDEAAYSFPCNTKRSNETKGLAPAIQEIISTLFGLDFLREIDKCLGK